MGQLIIINVCEVKTMIKRQLRPADAFHFNSSNSTAELNEIVHSAVMV